jgi:biofilm PGA synthesis N-glycosyltransferase PgaC
MKTRYVIITPVHNEEKFIEETIKSIIVQTITPKKWLIVNDGSTDRTGEIIEKYEARYNFITSLKLKRDDTETYYGHRTHVVLAGYKKVEKLQYDFLGILDADIGLEPTYYESILREFDRNPKLGIASGVYVDIVKGQHQAPVRDPDEISTPGAIQVFRRACYEDIGGFQALEYGGDDTLADIMARMIGWQTRHFEQYQVIHHRPVGTGKGTHILIAKYRTGLAEYVLGTHPLFILAKSFRRIFLEKPIILASTARLAGFLSGHLVVRKRDVPDEVIEFIRKEQLQRLWKYGLGRLKVFI